ncbi:YOL131W [Saccharomyces arboricola H-6]|uniref:YOL131W n=1 Tax=Saccharomyces arboricola (strain H-6 / AS 2.3317 / CBS 10644) TaxID=1160507 RepID=J8PWS9_SACAR|nr:YOL131W [Saccharomyces arboricola H-6]
MNDNRRNYDGVQNKVLERAELAHSIWNLRFNLNKVSKRILTEARLFQEKEIHERLQIGQLDRKYLYRGCMEEEDMPLIQDFKRLDSPPPVPPSSSQGENNETSVGSQY